METLISCFLLGIYLLSVHYGCDASNGPRVTVAQGVIEGKTVTQPGLVYDSFQGIPYAKPPTGKRRFKNPQPAKHWQGVLHATEVGDACPQYDQLYLNKYYGEENCLFLNVYVPKHSSHQQLPVLVNIHGGGFLVGDGGPLIYGPETFLKDIVIVVTLNYRLGALGFLSLNTPDIPGNAGLKDQALALKWVKENIAKFGGDDSKITLMGEGSGAASAMYHILSPQSKGLFTGVVIQSGTALAPWALQEQPESNAQKLAQVLGIGNRTDVAAFLKTIPDKDIVLAVQSPVFDDQVTLAFVPTIEKIHHHNQHPSYNKPFITSSPKDILKSGKINKVHVVIGSNINDGVLYLTKQFISPINSEAIIDDCVPHLKNFIPGEIIAKCGANETVEIETKILQKYFPETGNISNSLIELYTDVAYILNLMTSVQLLAKNSLAVWLYKYSYTGKKDLTRLTSGVEYTGAGYGDQLGYLFNVAFDGINQINASEVDVLTEQRMMEMAKSFIYYGNPSPVPTLLMPVIWKKVTPNNITALDISNNSSIIAFPHADVLKFWNDLAKICYKNETITSCEVTENVGCTEPEKCHHENTGIFGNCGNCENCDNGGNCGNYESSGNCGNCGNCENCENYKKCHNGYFHHISQLFSGHCNDKKHGKENIILHYLSVQISRLFK